MLTDFSAQVGCSSGSSAISRCWLLGPIRLNTTGRKIRPWNKPKDTTRKKTLKKARKVCDLEKARRTKAQNVERPPLKTAGPMWVNVFTIRSSLDPWITIVLFTFIYPQPYLGDHEAVGNMSRVVNTEPD